MQNRILFVDDERAVLDGIRRSMRRYRDRWESSFALGGMDALARVKGKDFDIVISDMHMPDVDGFVLLNYVRENSPQTLRIILSGQTQQAAGLRAISVAHQFLAKPCDGEQLSGMIKRALAIRDLCVDERHCQVIRGLGSLHSAPGLYLELTETMSDEEACIGDIACIVEKDMAMSSKVLQVVNSAYLGIPRATSKVKDAVSYLGMESIRALALAEGAFSALPTGGAFSAADLGKEQARGMLTGRVAAALCKQQQMAEHARLAGMLHDLGVLILGTEFPKEFAAFQEHSFGESTGIGDEGQIFGTNHARVGALLLGSWGLPLAVTEAVAFHHDPGTVEHAEFNVLTAVHLASAMVGALVEAPTLGSSITQIDHAYLRRLGVDQNLRSWCEIAHTIVGELGEHGNAA